MDSESIFARLPNELLYQVFEHAADADITTAATLTLVSSWVRHLVEPLLYQTVVLSSARGVHAFLDALSHKPATFGTRNVKHLGIFAPGPVDAIDRVLSACTNVDSLACGFSLPGYKAAHGCTTVQSMARPTEQHLLGLSCRDGWDSGLVGPAVRRLRVHLGAPQRLPVPQGEPLDAAHLGALAYLPGLTHLALVFKPSARRPAAALVPDLAQLVTPAAGEARRAKLECVLVQVLGTRAAQAQAVEALNAAALQAGGDALRIVAECAPSSAVCQWEDAVRGGQGVWDGAEEVVRSRLAAAAAKSDKS